MKKDRNNARPVLMVLFAVAVLSACNDAAAYNSRGIAYYNKGDNDRAIADYNEALRLDPNYAAAYLGRGNAYYLKGDYARARADWEKALQLDPNNANARNNLERLRSMGY